MVTVEIKKTVAEAIEEIENKLYIGLPLSTDTMLLALGALRVQEMDKHIKE